VAVLKTCLLIACAVGAVAVLAAGLPSRPAVSTPAGPAWHVYQRVHGRNASLGDVVATGRRHAWAGGASGAGTPVLYRWNGRRWRTISRPGRPGSSAASVAASSARNVWAVIAGEAAIDHWDGRSWSRFSFGQPARVEIDGLITTGRKDAWAFAYDNQARQETAFHYDGSGWTGTRLSVSLGGGSSALLASSSSRSDVWAWAYDTRQHRWVALHFNGHAWRVIRLPAGLLPAGRTVLPEQMLAESSGSVWGTVYAASGGSRGPVVLVHWNGRTWHRVAGRLPAGSLTGPVAPDGHGGLWLGAQRPAGGAFLAHYRHGRWSRSAIPGGRVTVTALALVPGTRTLWGSGTAAPGPGTGPGAVVLRYGS
jgi:hypothetical protein